MTEFNKYNLLSNGIFIDQMTPSSDLIGLIKNLRPLKTQFDLIRLGAAHDGGYLIPDDLNNIKVCFSPGVDDIALFETDLKEKYGIDSHLADFSVDAPPKGFSPKSFTKKYIGPTDDYHHMTLSSWLTQSHELKINQDLILQMDIEGGEYLSILSTPDDLISRFRIIAIEIHNIEDWGHRKYFDIVNRFFRKLLNIFYIVHNHPNNCCGLVNLGGIIAPRVFELTLLRKDRAAPSGYSDQFPHMLDKPNLTDRPDIALPELWWKS